MVFHIRIKMITFRKTAYNINQIMKNHINLQYLNYNLNDKNFYHS